MEKTIISEGKTTKEAIEKGLKQLKVSKDEVEVKILESEEKRSFFSILDPRIVKVELKIKENFSKEKTNKIEKKQIEFSSEELKKATENLKTFLDEIIKYFEGKTTYEIKNEDEKINVNIYNKDLGFLIGYRGETLYAFQEILSSVASKKLGKRVKVILDIEGYKEKRKTTLEELAQKVANTVIKTGKSVKLEPMKPYERKIIHSKLQSNTKIETKSIGEEPKRRIVISLK